MLTNVKQRLQAKQEEQSTVAPDITQHSEDAEGAEMALGAGMMIVGVLFGLAWAWLCFFRRNKSPRNGMTGSSGQVGRQSSAVIYILRLIFTGVCGYSILRGHASLKFCINHFSSFFIKS